MKKTPIIPIQLSEDTLDILGEKSYYHGTHCKHIPNIKKYGLTINNTIVHRESRGNGIYVSRNINTALVYAYDASKDCPPYLLGKCDANPNNMCIIKITKMPKKAKIYPDGFGDYIIDTNIPPSYLEILRPNQLKKIFKVEDLLDAVF